MKRAFIRSLSVLALVAAWAPFQVVVADTGAGLQAGAGDQLFAVVGPDVDSVSGSTLLAGWRGITTSLTNLSTAPVTNPTITFQTGYDISYFLPYGYSSLPIITTQASLGPSDTIPSNITTAVPATFAPGFDSSRSVKPPVIPVPGGRQTVTVTLRLTDFATSGLFGFGIGVGVDPSPDLSGIAVVSAAGPSNLDQGEVLVPVPGGSGPGTLASWFLQGAVFDKAYAFTVVLDVPNPFGRAFFFKPHVGLNAVPFGTGTDCGLSCPGPSSSITIPEPAFDGPTTPGSGQVIFSVEESTLSWQVVLGQVNPGTNLGYLELVAICNPKSHRPGC
jgi:hypothetical protein